MRLKGGDQWPSGSSDQPRGPDSEGNAPQDVCVLISRTCECHLTWQRILCRCDSINDYPAVPDVITESL